MATNAADVEAYHALCAYTLTHGDPFFIHQLVVDAHAAQSAGAQTKPIGISFALVGLYLAVERGFTGRQVQRVHMLLARHRRAWPAFPVPATTGHLRATEVLAAPPGPERDAAIHAWCASVWTAYAESRDQVVTLLQSELP